MVNRLISVIAMLACALTASAQNFDPDTELGDSCSLAFHFDEATHTAVAVAIHRFGDATANFGTRLTPAIIADIENAIAANT